MLKTKVNACAVKPRLRLEKSNINYVLKAFTGIPFFPYNQKKMTRTPSVTPALQKMLLCALPGEAASHCFALTLFRAAIQALLVLTVMM